MPEVGMLVWIEMVVGWSEDLMQEKSEDGVYDD